MPKRLFGLFISLVSLFVLIGPASAQELEPQHSDPAWQAWYWNNPSLAGPPAVRRAEGKLDHNWGLGAPDPAIPADGFSARWTRYFDAPPGTYQVTATSDDGVRVWIDGDLVINEWYDHGAKTVSATKELGPGHHLMVVEYYENRGEALVRVTLRQGNAPTIYDWRGEYFSNTALAGEPILVRNDREINFDWGFGSPAPGPLGVDSFSVRWTRTINLPAGAYRFRATVDDGVRLWVNHHLLIDAWRVQAETTYTGEIYLPGGDIPIKMEYFEQSGQALAHLSWAGGGSLPRPTPYPPPDGPDPTGGWFGEYYPNRHLSGAPAITRQDRRLDFDWGHGSPAPGLPADNFSARWTREVYLDAGSYTFRARHDDGVRLWVDGNLVIDAWFDQAAAVHAGSRYLRGGRHQIRVAYYEHVDLASLQVWWTSGSEPPPAPPPHYPGAEVVVDNIDAGFRWGGPRRGLHVTPLGIGGSAYWTYNSTYSPVNYGKWIPRLPDAGRYELFAFIPRDYSTSTAVRYRILHNDQRHDRVISQYRYRDQWVSLGTYYFNARNTGREAVLVYDNTRERYASRTVAFDAIKFVPR